MTTFVNCNATDPLYQHDVYRLTLVPTSGFFGPLASDANESLTVQAALDAIFAEGSIDNLTTWGSPLTPNPYVNGDLAATFDVLVTYTTGTVGQLVANVLALGEGAVSGFWNDWSSAALSNVDIKTCEQVVGANTAQPGTTDATEAVYSTDAATTRAQEARTAGASVSATAANNWLANLESTVGTVGTYVVIGGGLLALYWLYSQARRVKRIVT